MLIYMQLFTYSSSCVIFSKFSHFLSLTYVLSFQMCSKDCLSEHSSKNKNIPGDNLSQNTEVFVWADTRWVQKPGDAYTSKPSW